MSNIKFPKIIDEHYDTALERQYESEAFRTFYTEAWTSGKDEVMAILNQGSAYYDSDIEDALTHAQATAERVGFLVGFRHAERLMQEVYA